MSPLLSLQHTTAPQLDTYEIGRPASNRAPPYMPKFDRLLSLGWYVRSELVTLGFKDRFVGKAAQRWNKLYDSYLMKENSSHRHDRDNELVSEESLFPDWVFEKIFVDMPTADTPLKLDTLFSRELEDLYDGPSDRKATLLEALTLFRDQYTLAIQEFKNFRSITRNHFELVRVSKEYDRTLYDDPEEEWKINNRLSDPEIGSIESLLQGMNQRSKVASTSSIYEQPSEELKGVKKILYDLSCILDEGRHILPNSAAAARDISIPVTEVSVDLLIPYAPSAQTQSDLDSLLAGMDKWVDKLSTHTGVADPRLCAWRVPRIQLVRALRDTVAASMTSTGDLK